MRLHGKLCHDAGVKIIIEAAKDKNNAELSCRVENLVSVARSIQDLLDDENVSTDTIRYLLTAVAKESLLAIADIDLTKRLGCTTFGEIAT